MYKYLIILLIYYELFLILKKLLIIQIIIYKNEILLHCDIFIILMLPIIELYLNYNAKDFPGYHERRIKFDVCSIFCALVPFSLIISASLCGRSCFACCYCIYSFSVIAVLFAGSYYFFVTFYLYFAYDGGKIIKSRGIRIMFWISFISFIINFIINLCFNCSCNPSMNENNREFYNIERNEQRVPLLSN